jgi:HSP20 family protein
MSTKSVARSQNGGLLLNSMFGDFLRPWDSFFNEPLSRTFTTPAVNVSETDKSYNLSVAAPGLRKEDFKVDVQGNQLYISAEKEERKENKDDQYSRKEYNYSSFSRMFTLPDEVEAGKIEAEYKDGELQLVLPKNGKAKTNTQSVKIK